MRFLNWIKSLFKKTSSSVTPSTPVSSKGWDPYWSELIKRLVYSNIQTFDAASDIHNIRPDWSNLSNEQKSQVMEAFFKRLIYFESGYNPLSESVDVGNKHDKQTWSVGLLQLSGVDKVNLGLSVGWDYDGLKNPENNITQGIAIMVNQIKKRGKIILAKGEKGNPAAYWAPLIAGGKYDKSVDIIKTAQALNVNLKDSVIEKPKEDATPWMGIAMAEVGVTESRNPKRVIEYHQATSLKAKDVKTPWCASFMSWVLTKSGLSSPKTAWARDFLKYGRKLDKPQKYCIMVFERGAPGGSSHVTLWTGVETELHYKCLGGNQGDAVNDSSWYLKQDLLGCRWPE